MDSKDEKYFPSDYDEYYYYCRISIVEEAKEKYLKCNDLLLGFGINNSPAMKLLPNETNEKRQIIYNKYKKLYDDFVKYCDKLIDKDNVDNLEIYIRYMENLMRISNETISFTYQNFGMRKEKGLREKLEYDGKKEKLSYIINQNRNVSYILNPDDIATRIANKYIKPILLFIILAILLISCLFAQYGLNAIIASDSFIDMVFGYIYIGAFALFLILSIILLYTRIKYRKSINFDELKGSLDVKNYLLVVHPYKNRKFSFKNIMEILRIINDFRK